jgi:hypothetical protein
VRDWYVESFKELRSFPKVRDANDEVSFTKLLKHIYSRHKNVVPVMAMGVAGAPPTPPALRSSPVGGAATESRRSNFGNVKGSLKAMVSPFRIAQRAMSR